MSCGECGGTADAVMVFKFWVYRSLIYVKRYVIDGNNEIDFKVESGSFSNASKSCRRISSDPETIYTVENIGSCDVKIKVSGLHCVVWSIDSGVACSDETLDGIIEDRSIAVDMNSGVGGFVADVSDTDRKCNAIKDNFVWMKGTLWVAGVGFSSSGS